MTVVSLSSQSYIFLCSLLCGVGLGAVYTIFKLARGIFNHRKLPTVLLDIGYMLAVTVVTFIFSVGFTDGYVRYYTPVGELAGILMYKLTLGRIFDRLFSLLIKAFFKAYGFVQKNISVFAKKLLKASGKVLYNKIKKRTEFENKCKGVR